MIQLTIKDNYKAYTDLHNQHNPDDIKDFVEDPDLILTTPKYAVESAFAWWSKSKVNELCINHQDATIEKVSVKVNGGTHSLAKRMSIFKNIWEGLE